eukprot:862918-Ditylum_brightwellii.AAC.1
MLGEQKNAHKKPNWFKSNKEKGLAAKDDENRQYEDTEFLLMGMASSEKVAFAINSNILKDPNIFIGDTGATCDSTFSKTGLTNVH